MGQTNWFIDNAGSRENSGADSGHPIPELERMFRMGPRPDWSANEYHIRYLTDTSSVILTGVQRPNCSIFVHGSATDGQGQTTLYSGTANTLVAQNTAINTPYQITSTGLASGWTADGLLNKRIRMTSGAALGGKSWSLKDLTGKNARCNDFTEKGTYTAPFTTPFNAVTPAQNDTFVVEKLTQLSSVVIDIEGHPTTAGGRGFIFESVDLGANYFYGGGNVAVNLDGCSFTNATGNVSGTLSTLTSSGGFFGGTSWNPPRCVRLELWGCCSVAGQLFLGALGTIGVSRLILQGGCANFTCPQGNDNGANISTHIGAFDNAARPSINVKGGTLDFANPGVVFWGSGNSTASLHVRPGGQFLFQNLGLTSSNFPITTSAVSDVILGRSNRTSIEAFDSRLGIYTPARLLSWANLLLEIDSGGFCQQGFPGSPQVVDALTGAAFMPIA